MSPRRAAVTPPQNALEALTLSAQDGVPVQMNGITFYPPSSTRATWRLKYSLDGRVVERSGGSRIETAWGAFVEMDTALCQAGLRGSNSGAEKGAATVADLVSQYIAQRGAHGSWQSRTARDRTTDLRPLATTLSTVRCEELTAAHVRGVLVAQSGTYARYTHPRLVVRRENARTIFANQWQCNSYARNFLGRVTLH